jgi:hypothetical protein
MPPLLPFCLHVFTFGTLESSSASSNYLSLHRKAVLPDIMFHPHMSLSTDATATAPCAFPAVKINENNFSCNCNTIDYSHAGVVLINLELN